MFVVLLISAPLSQKLEPPANPARFNTSAIEAAVQFGASNAFTALIEDTHFSQDRLDALAGQMVGSYYRLDAGQTLLTSAAKEALGLTSPSCGWELFGGMLQRIGNEDDGHLKILANLKDRGASLAFAKPGGGQSLAESALDGGEIYLYRAILKLNNELGRFDSDMAIANAIRKGNTPAVEYMMAMAPESFTPKGRSELVEKFADVLTADTLSVLMTPELALSKGPATHLLERFIQSADASLIQDLLRSGADIHEDEPSFLRLAALTGRSETVQLLLDAGVKATAKSADGHYVLAGLAKAVIDAREGRVTGSCNAEQVRKELLMTVHMLIASGAPLAANDQGETLFGEFLETDVFDPDFLIALTPSDLTLREALFSSVEAGNRTFVEWLIEKRGVSAASRDTAGRSLLAESLSSATSIPLAPYIFSQIKSLDGQLDPSQAINALEEMYKFDCNECIEKLFLSGLDTNLIPESGRSLLWTAIERGDLSFASRLMENGASPLTADSLSGRPLDFLCRIAPPGYPQDVVSFRRKLSQLFLQYNVDLRTVSYDGHSTLYACFQSHVRDQEVLDAVLLLGGGVIEPALVEYVVGSEGRVELDWLKRNKVNLSGAAADGTPYLHVAIRDNNFEALNLLLEDPNVDVNVKNSAGISAIEYAFVMRNAQVARTLQAAGATIPTTAEALRQSGFVTDNDELSDVVLLDVLSQQLLAELPSDNKSLSALVDRMDSANKLAITPQVWSFGAEDPWIPIGQVNPLDGDREISFKDSKIAVNILTNMSDHQYAVIARSGNNEPFPLCLPPNRCYKQTCGYCSIYGYIVSTGFSLPSCGDVAASECMSTATVENDAASEATITITQGGQPAKIVSPGNSVNLERSQGPVDIAASARGAVFYIRFDGSLDTLPVLPQQLAFNSSKKLELYLKALDLRDQISGQQSARYKSVDSATVALRYWSAKLATAGYTNLAAVNLKKDLQRIESVPPIFDSLLDALGDAEQLKEVQLPVLAAQLKGLAESMETSQRARLLELAAELDAATQTAGDVTNRLVEVRDALMVHHKVLSDSLRVDLLEYLQYGDEQMDNPLKQIPSLRKSVAMGYLRRKPWEVVSDAWREKDARLIQRFESAN